MLDRFKEELVVERGIISILANVMKSEEDNLWRAGKGEGEEALELHELEEEEEEESVKLWEVSLESEEGKEERDLKSGVKDFDKTGKEVSFWDFVRAVEGGRTGDSWRWMTGVVEEVEAWGSATNSMVCRGVGDKDGAGDVASGCVILKLGNEGPRWVAFRVGVGARAWLTPMATK